jgi:hypothetical protein
MDFISSGTMYRKQRIIQMALTVVGCIIIAAGCHTSPQAALEKQITHGKALSEKYCVSCHLYPSPALLDQETWLKHVLPAMAPKLGIQVWGEDQYYPSQQKASAAMITYAEWLDLVTFYKATAPEQLAPVKAPIAPLDDWAVFEMKRPQWKDTGRIATTTMVIVDSMNNRIYSGDADRGWLYQWDQQLKQVNDWHFPSAPVDLQFTNSGKNIWVTCIGFMQAVDEPKGLLLNLDVTQKKAAPVVQAAFLKRPVQAIEADINQDGLTDWIVCSFGHNKGGLYYMQQTPDHQYEQHTIREVPGAIHAVTGDFNNDGWPDVMALFAYDDEGIWLFLNDHKGGFVASNLLRFPPVYGSTSFQLVDFNQDGLLDILYTCGDNADYSKILKPYHGVYIFLNQGDYKYKAAWFYPVNGCTKAMAADFNGDGKLDIASIAFFGDLKDHPSEKFLYFQQDSLLHFVPYAIPIQQEGRWFSMDVNDFNHDGAPDIVLGNYSMGFINQDNLKQDWNRSQPLLLLENKRHSSLKAVK